MSRSTARSWSRRIALVSHHSVRNRGTIGGSLCHNDPASEMPLVVNLVGATLIARSQSGERAIAADNFFKGNFETALDAQRAAGGNPRADSGQRSRLVVPGGQPAQGGLRAGRRARRWRSTAASAARSASASATWATIYLRRRRSKPRSRPGAERAVVLRRRERRPCPWSSPPPPARRRRATVATWSRS